MGWTEADEGECELTEDEKREMEELSRKFKLVRRSALQCFFFKQQKDVFKNSQDYKRVVMLTLAGELELIMQLLTTVQIVEEVIVGCNICK